MTEKCIRITAENTKKIFEKKFRRFYFFPAGKSPGGTPRKIWEIDCLGFSEDTQQPNQNMGNQQIDDINIALLNFLWDSWICRNEYRWIWLSKIQRE